MIPGHIEGANILLRGNGADVMDLYALQVDGGYMTAWFPTPEEMLALQCGAPVYLHVYGESFPPVWVGVKKEA